MDTTPLNMRKICNIEDNFYPDKVFLPLKIFRFFNFVNYNHLLKLD